MDDFSFAESINIGKLLSEDQNHVMPSNNSKVVQLLNSTKEYADLHMMKLNYAKTDLLVFNPCRTIDLQPDIEIEGHKLEVVEEKKILGIILRSDLKWSSNTKNMVQKGYKRLWIIRRLQNLGADEGVLVDIFKKQVRSILEFGAPVWHSGLTAKESEDIERVQKSFCHILLGSQYNSYKFALYKLNLNSLVQRRKKLCLRFALKAEKHEKFKHWFKPTVKTRCTRLKQPKYVPVVANHARMENSPLCYLTKLLNDHYS